VTPASAAAPAAAAGAPADEVSGVLAEPPEGEGDVVLGDHREAAPLHLHHPIRELLLRDVAVADVVHLEGTDEVAELADKQRGRPDLPELIRLVALGEAADDAHAVVEGRPSTGLDGGSEGSFAWTILGEIFRT